MHKTSKLIIMAAAFSATLTFSHLSVANKTIIRTDDQVNYLAAKAAIDNKDLARFKNYRNKLSGYPLNLYLDYHANIDKILKADGKKAKKSLKAFADSPLFSSGRYRYLVNAGKEKRWADFLAVSPSSPRDISLQCYFRRAQLTKGLKTEAFKGAEKLWLYGRSRPKVCDPLFDAWTKAGYESQALIWQRMLLAFEANQSGLLKYLAKKVTKSKKYATQLVSVYQDPMRLKKTSAYLSKNSRANDIVKVGLKKLARRDLTTAVSLFKKYKRKMRLSSYQRIEIQRYIVRRGLIKQDDNVKSFIDNALPKIKSDDFFERRLRWALRESDSKTVKAFLPQLNENKQQTSRWQYWNLINGLTNQPDVEKTRLLEQRNFYGFVMAKASNTSIKLNHKDNQTDDIAITRLLKTKAMARIIELLAINKLSAARSEWVMLLNRLPNGDKTQLGLYAQKKGWHDLAVQASIQAKLWDNMSLRFPDAQQTEFIAASNQYKVDIDEIRAIARRESAFYVRAQSGVGARGLMQLMPATAKQTAKGNKIKYRGKSQLFDPQINTQLGSAYYAELLQKFDQNRVLATAAYNAGPHRVKRWLKESNGKLDVMSFIESIPFKETREYVQAVVSYRAIYQARKNKPVSIFSKKELNFKY